MPRTSSIQTNFTAGEITPRLLGRVDLSIYFNACSHLDNLIVHSYGGVMRRPGFRYIATTKNGNEPCRLIPFRFSRIQSYMLEFGDAYIRFYWSRGQVLSGGVPYEIVSPYATDDLDEIATAQSADVMYLAHPDYGIRTLSRTGHTSWAMASFKPQWGPFLPENKTAVTITPSGKTGSITLTASAALFQSGHVGTLWKIFHRVVEVIETITKGESSSSATGVSSVEYDFTSVSTGPAIAPHEGQQLSCTLSGTWVATMALKYSSDGGLTWATHLTSTINTSVLLRVDLPNTMFRWECTGYTSGTVESLLELSSGSPGSGLSGSKSGKLLVPSGHTVEWIITGTWTGTITIERSWDNGENWDSWKVFTSNDSDEEANEFAQEVLYRFDSDLDSGSASLTLKHKKITEGEGVVEITAVTDSTHAAADVLVSDDRDEPNELVATTATAYWSEGAWSDVRGWPRAIAFHEQRFFAAGTRHAPQTIWASCVGDYPNFRAGDEDADALSFTLASNEVNAIQWMLPSRKLVIGTVGNEWQLGSSSGSDPLTPTNVQAIPETGYGSMAIAPVRVGSASLFVQQHARRIRELVYEFQSDGLVAPDLNLLSPHLLSAKIAGMAYQDYPYKVLWTWLEDGALRAMTYERDNKVMAWQRHSTDGLVESMAVIPGADRDELWACIQRTLNGSPTYCIELLETDEYADRVDRFFVDCGLTYDGIPVSAVSGLEHLAGKTVAVQVDGAVHRNLVVSDAGTIALDVPGSIVHVGLPYTSMLKTLPLEGGAPGGSGQGKTKRIHEVTLRLLDSLGPKIGVNESSLLPVPVRRGLDRMDSPPELFSGDYNVRIDSSYGLSPIVVLVQDQPAPLELLAIVNHFSVYD